jgi:UDP-glucose 4-epimerase
MGKRCVVVGGGLLGSHTAAALADAGHSVSVFSRSFSHWLHERRADGLEIGFVEGEIPGARRLDGLLHGADVVFCLAGNSTPALSARDPVAAATNALVPALTVLDSAHRGEVKRVVLASSGGTVYGRVGEGPTPETHDVMPISAHGVSALAIESYASFYARVHDLETVVLRYSNVYGPGGRVRGDQGVIAAWCEALAREEFLSLIGDDDVARDFLYAADAAAAALAAIDVEPGVYNVGAGRATSLREVLDALAAVSGREPKVVQTTGRAVDVKETHLDHRRFSERTGWEPTHSLEQGLAATWEWVSSPAARAEVGGALPGE